MRLPRAANLFRILYNYILSRIVDIIYEKIGREINLFFIIFDEFEDFVQVFLIYERLAVCGYARIVILVPFRRGC